MQYSRPIHNDELHTQRLAMVASRTINGVVITDKEQRIEWVNEGFTRITGYTLEEVRGRRPGQILQGPSTDPETRRYMHEQLKRDEGFTAELINYRKSGEAYWVSIEVQPLFDESGAVNGYMGLETDITLQKQAEEEARHRAAQQTAVASLGRLALSNPDPLSFVDPVIKNIHELISPDYIGMVQHIGNGVFMLKAGYGWKEEAIGSVIRLSLDPELMSRETSEPIVIDLFTATTFKKTSLAREHRIRGGTGVLIPGGENTYWGALITGRAADQRFSSDDLTFLVSVAQIFTAVIERDRIQRQLILERNQAQDAARHKSEYLASMSHEIRTTLTGVIGFASVLSEESTGQMREFADLIEKSGRRLLEVLNSVLDLARLEANQVSLELQHLNIPEEIAEIVRFFEPIATEKQIEMTFTVAPDCSDAHALLDRGAFIRILQNLLGNAVKFTLTGGISVRICGTGEVVSIAIQDSGTGIDPAFLPHIFEEFRQESRGFSGKHGGTGIGLSITHRLVHLMNGTIEVESEKGVGSTFTVSFPRAPVMTETRILPPPDALPDLPSAKILLVEDNPETRFLMKHLLEGMYDVTTVSSGDEAIQQARERMFDLVLMDINLGDGPNGIETLSALRSIDGYDVVPVVALTAYALPGDRERFLQDGFDDYLSKPFDASDLLQIFAQNLSV